MKNRLHLLGTIVPVALSLALVVACGDDNPTSTGPDSETPEATIFSFEAIQGDWEGESSTSREYWVEISITRDSARSGATVGTLEELEEEGGDALCLAELVAVSSEPPTYLAEFNKSFVAEGWGCDGTAKLEYDESAETLTYSWRKLEQNDFNVLAVLPRDN